MDINRCFKGIVLGLIVAIGAMFLKINEGSIACLVGFGLGLIFNNLYNILK